MFMTKRSLMKCSFLAAFIVSFTSTCLFSEQNYGNSYSNESYRGPPQTYYNQQQGTCQGGSCNASANQQPSSCQGGSCNVGNQQNGTCQGGRCHDHYGSHNGEPNGWHYPHPDYPRNAQCNGQICGQAGDGADNGSYVQNCQSGSCNSAHRPDQYNVNYNGYPYDCSYYNYTYPYDGNWYYSVHPWLDGF